MKKILFLILLSFNLCGLSAIQARPGVNLPEGRKIGFTIIPFIDLMYGYNDELVFDGDSASYPYNSRLHWEIEPAVIGGLSLSINEQDRFFLNLAAGSTLNPVTGKMQDYDWMSGYFRKVDTEWTHRSESIIHIKNSFLFDSNFIYRVKLPGIYELDFLLFGIKYAEWYWHDSLESKDYPPSWDSDFIKGSNGINYYVKYAIPYGGLGANIRHKHFSGTLMLMYSPRVNAESRDHHISRGLYFYDSFKGGDYWGFLAGGAWHFSRHFSINLAWMLDFVPQLTGNTLIYNDSGYFESESPKGAGIRYVAASLSLGLACRF